MNSPRKDNRISPSSYSEYMVRIDLDELTLEGFLGSVSDSGLSVVMSLNCLMDEVGSNITGAILSKSLEEYVDFQGRVAWCINSSNGMGDYLTGIEFEFPIQLSKSLLSKSLSDF